MRLASKSGPAALFLAAQAAGRIAEIGIGRPPEVKIT